MSETLTNCRLLLVEDIESEAKLAIRHLRRVSGWRFTIEHCERLTPALTRASQQRFDVILLDLNLPDGAGIEVCRRMAAAAPVQNALSAEVPPLVAFSQITRTLAGPRVFIRCD